MAMEKHEIVIAGRGGQGILLAGYILGKALVDAGYYVVNSEEYSAETRGGDSKSELVVTKGEEPDIIKVRKADLAIFMYTDQMKKYSKLVGDSATVFLDSTFIESKPEGWSNVIMVPFTEIAEHEVGNIRTANMVILGMFASKVGMVSLDLLEKSMSSVTRPTWIEVNKKALQKGYSLKV